METTWAPAATGVFTLVCALIFGVIAEMSRRGTLPRNSLVGIRLISTMKSDEAWERAHRKTWAGFALMTIIFFVGGLILLLSGEMTETHYVTVVSITYVSIVPVLIVQGVLAHKAAS